MGVEKGRPERRNAANGRFSATKKAPAPPVCRPVDQLVIAELAVAELAVAELAVIRPQCTQ